MRGFWCVDVSITVYRASLERLLDLRDARVLLHHQEVRLSVLVQLPDSTEQKARHRVFVPDHGDQFASTRHSQLLWSSSTTERRFGSAGLIM